jgi:hypothetical protein
LDAGVASSYSSRFGTKRIRIRSTKALIAPQNNKVGIDWAVVLPSKLDSQGLVF